VDASPAYNTLEWHDFAVALAGASGALLGLAFVAISLNLDAIIQAPTLAGRAAEALVFFAFPLIGSLILLTPGLSRTGLAVAQLVIVLGLLLMVVRLDLPRLRQERGDPLSWRLGHLLPSLVVTTFAALGAIGTFTSSIGGLYWLAASMGVSTLMGLVTSWVLLVEIKR
jgi:hypothetical protein